MHPIENILKITMSELKEMIDVNTIVGTPFVSPGGCTVIPISKVSFGFVSGGAEYGAKAHTREESDYPFSGGTASGITINPVAFMVADEQAVKLLTVSGRNTLDKLMENIPQMVSELKDVIFCSCGCEEEYDEDDEGEEKDAGNETSSSGQSSNS